MRGIKKNTVFALHRPTGNAILTQSGPVALELATALLPVNGPTEIGHDLRIRVEIHECRTMAIVPFGQPDAARLNRLRHDPHDALI